MHEGHSTGEGITSYSLFLEIYTYSRSKISLQYKFLLVLSCWLSDMLVLSRVMSIEKHRIYRKISSTFQKQMKKLGIIFYGNIVILPAVQNCLLSEYRILKLILNYFDLSKLPVTLSFLSNCNLIKETQNRYLLLIIT